MPGREIPRVLGKIKSGGLGEPKHCFSPVEIRAQMCEALPAKAVPGKKPVEITSRGIYAPG